MSDTPGYIGGVIIFVELPDRDELQAIAVARAHRRRMLLIGLMLLISIAIPAGFLVTGDGDWSAGKVAALLLIPFVMTAVVFAALYPLMRSNDRQVPLSFGTDKATQRAVQRALRTGRPADARIDALARDTATRTLRRSWSLWVFVGAVALQAVGAVLRIVGNADPMDLGMAALLILLSAIMLGTLIMARRRSRAYLAAPRGHAGTSHTPV
jgi:hypothetical protein